MPPNQCGRSEPRDSGSDPMRTSMARGRWPGLFSEMRHPVMHNTFRRAFVGCGVCCIIFALSHTMLNVYEERQRLGSLKNVAVATLEEAEFGARCLRDRFNHYVMLIVYEENW